MLGVIDAQYILRRNFSVLNKGKEVDVMNLVKIFMYSIMKLQKEHELDRVVLAWDKSPYIKKEGIPFYKCDRVYASQAMVDEESDPVEKAKKLIRFKNETAFHSAKSFILSTFTPMGLCSIMKQGFEADDIGFYFAKIAKENEIKIKLITIDRDWVSFVNRFTTYVTPTHNMRLGMLKSKISLVKELQVPLYDLGVLEEIYSNSHNNVQGYAYKDTVNFSEFCSKMYQKDETLPGYGDAYVCYKAMNMLPRIDMMRGEIEDAFRSKYTDPNRMYNYTKSIFMFFRRDSIFKLLGGWEEDLIDELNVSGLLN